MRAFLATIFAGLLALAFVAVPPSRAQFASQGQVVTGTGGSANAQTGTVVNAASYADLVNVVLIYVPAAANTGDATLNLNGFGAIHFKKGNGSGTTLLVGGELAVGQPMLIEYDGTNFQALGPVSLPIGAGLLSPSAFSFGSVPNFQLNASVGSNQLTISVVANSGSAATAANPINVAFRDTTIANGDPVLEQITGAISFTIASSSTMGCQNGIMCRLWVFLINNAGTVDICAYNANSAGTSIVALAESILQTSASGTTGGSSAQTLYCAESAVAAKAVRYVGYIDISEATAGTWASGPTKIQLFGPGIRKPGDIVQIKSTSAATTLAITPMSAANLVLVNTTGTATATAQLSVTITLNRGATGILTQGYNGSAVNDLPFALTFLDAPAAATSQSYNLTASAGFSFGTTSIVLEEIMGALEEPANDNGEPLSMVG